MIPLRGALRLIALRGVLRRSAFFIAAAALAAGAAVALQARQPAASATSSGWVETWAAAPIKATRDVINKAYVGFNDSTVRNVVFTSVGGSEVRIRLSNLFGTRPLDVGQASVGEVASEGSLAGPRSRLPSTTAVRWWCRWARRC